MTEAVLVFVFRLHQVLLGKHQRGIGQGRWNGLGGKVEVKKGETLKEAAVRECRQEVGIKVRIHDPVGVIVYHHAKHGDWRVTIFRTDEFKGQPRSSAEMVPEWFVINQLPHDQMWSNDRVWMPHVLRNRHFRGEVWLRADDTMERHTIEQVATLRE